MALSALSSAYLFAVEGQGIDAAHVMVSKCRLAALGRAASVPESPKSRHFPVGNVSRMIIRINGAFFSRHFVPVRCTTSPLNFRIFGARLAKAHNMPGNLIYHVRGVYGDHHPLQRQAE